MGVILISVDRLFKLLWYVRLTQSKPNITIFSPKFKTAILFVVIAFLVWQSFGVLMGRARNSMNPRGNRNTTAANMNGRGNGEGSGGGRGESCNRKTDVHELTRRNE